MNSLKQRDVSCETASEMHERRVEMDQNQRQGREGPKAKQAGSDVQWLPLEDRDCVLTEYMKGMELGRHLVLVRFSRSYILFPHAG